MAGAWFNNTGLNPHAHEFVPRSGENNGSEAAQPPDPFLEEVKHSLANLPETANVISPSVFPGQTVHSHAQCIPVYCQPTLPLIQNYAVPQVSLENEPSNVNQLTPSGNFSDPIHKNYEICGDFREGRGDQSSSRGNKRLVSGRDSRNSEGSDQEKSVSASNKEPFNQSPNIDVSQTQQYPRKGREGESSWNEEHADNRFVKSVERRPPYHERGKIFVRGNRGRNDNFSHKNQRHWVDQEKSVDPSNEEWFNKRDATHKSHYEDGYTRGSGRPRGNRASRGYDNFSNRGQSNFEYQSKSVHPSNEEYESSDMSGKIQHLEDGYRRGTESRSFRGNNTFSYGDRNKDFGKNYDSRKYGSERRGGRENLTVNDRASDGDSKNFEKSNNTEETSLSPSNEKFFGQGIGKKNDQRWPNEHRRGKGKGHYTDKENWRYHNKKRDIRDKEPSDINPLHGDSQGTHVSNNNIDEKSKYEHSSERRNSKNLEESNFSEEKSIVPLNEDQGRDKNVQRLSNKDDDERGRGRGGSKVGDKGNWYNYNKHGASSTQEPREINPEHRDPQRKHGSSNNRDERGKITSERSEMPTHNYGSNYNRTETELKIENTQEANESKKETNIPPISYSKKTQMQNIKKNKDNPKESDWRDTNKESNFNKGGGDNQRHRSNVSENSKEITHDKRKRNSNPETENPENKLQRNNQQRKFDSARENKNYGKKSGTRNSDFERTDGRNLENDINKPIEDTETYQSLSEHAVGDIAQNKSKKDTPESLVELDSEEIQESKGQAKKGMLSKEKDKRNTRKSGSKFHQSYSDTPQGDKEDNNSDLGDNLQPMESLMAKENKTRMQNEVCQEKLPITKDNDKKNKKDTSRKSDKQFLDPRMERKKEKAVDGSKGMSVTSPRESSTKVVTSYLDDSFEKEKRDKEYDFWDNHWEKIDNFKIVCEIQGDLFAQPKDFSLAHCVAEDLRMGSGIAVDFKREFKNLPNLLDQRAKQGGLATIPDQENGRFVYYLVTKKESTGKPTYYSMWKSLCKMRDHVKENEVKKIAIPRLGCGLDRLEWEKVKTMLEYLFKEMELEIRVCNFQQINEEDRTADDLQSNLSEQGSNYSNYRQHFLRDCSTTDTSSSNTPGFSTECASSSSSTSPDPSQTLSRLKRKSKKAEDQQALLDRCFGVMSKIGDSFEIFGDYVADELRNMHSKAPNLQGHSKREIQRIILNMNDDYESTLQNVDLHQSQRSVNEESLILRDNSSSQSKQRSTNSQFQTRFVNNPPLTLPANVQIEAAVDDESDDIDLAKYYKN